MHVLCMILNGITRCVSLIDAASLIAFTFHSQLPNDRPDRPH